MYWLIVPSIAGALVGAALLRVTPPALFERLVPALIFFATLLFALQDRVQRFLNISPEHHGSQWLIAAIDAAILKAVRENQVTSDIGGKLGTREAGDYIAAAVQ